MDNNIHQFCALNVADMEEPSLFLNILPNHKPVAIKWRYFNRENQSFINKEIQKLLSKVITEESDFPCRVILVIVNDPTNRQKMCVHYFQTINLNRESDAYPLPTIYK